MRVDRELLAQAGLLDSAHDCSEGGLVVTLAECGFARGLGMNIELSSQDLPAEFILFGEDASRVVVSCDPSNLPRIQEEAVKYGLSADSIGETASERVEIRLNGRLVVSAEIGKLRDEYECALEKALWADVETVTIA